uniref:ferroxidase n=1 Tax=Chelonoidis abingdonii TaxID=106734 RepID=A0A8C0HE56_CHEAB
MTWERMESQVCQNFHAECEAAVNLMVNLELYASYVYLSLVSTMKIWGSIYSLQLKSCCPE